MKAQILKITVEESVSGGEECTREYSFDVWELPGGMIQVPETNSYDSFYADREALAEGYPIITDVKETGEYLVLRPIEVIKNLALSHNDYGAGSVPDIAWEFIHTCFETEAISGEDT